MSLLSAALLQVAGGCAPHQPDIASDAARLTGISNALVIQGNAETLNATEPTGGLALARAVLLTLRHDPRLQSALARVRAAEADSHQARLLPNPILSIDVRVPTAMGDNTAFEATLTGDLLSLLQKPGEITAADDRLQGAAADALATALDVVNETQVSYATIQANQDSIRHAQDRLRLLEQAQSIGQARLKAGDVARLDVLSFNTQVTTARLDLADLQETAREERLHLARLIGQPGADADWQIAPAVDAMPVPAPEAVWVELALKNRPEIQSKTWELRALNGDLSAADFSPLAGGDLGIHSEHDPQWRVGPMLTVPLPIFDFGQAAREKIMAQQMAARQDLLEEQRQIVQEVRSAWAAFKLARDSFNLINRELLPQQQEQLAIARQMYQKGENDLSVLLLAQADYGAALAKRADALQKSLLARYKLERAAGGSGIAAALLAIPSTPPPQSATQPATRSSP